MKSKVLTIKNISTGYKNGVHKKVVSTSLSASISQGKLIALLGPNGCGKSTLLRSIAGLQPLLAGKVRITGKHIETLSGKEKARLLSLVLTDKIASAFLIVKDIIAIGRHPYAGVMGVLQEKDKVLINNAIKDCKLDSYADRIYGELSDGEKQRVMLARALAQDTPLMMLDEPTAHLDLPNRVGMMKMLRDLSQKTQKAILLSTHELDLALQWCDAIWLMDEQGKMYVGTPEDLVLNGAFATVFNTHSLFFDTALGVFKMKREPQGKVSLSGNKIVKIWTQRALERVGYQIVDTEDKVDFTIHITEKKEWIVKQEKRETIHKTIASLLEALPMK